MDGDSDGALGFVTLLEVEIGDAGGCKFGGFFEGFVHGDSDSELNLVVGFGLVGFIDESLILVYGYFVGEKRFFELEDLVFS